MYQEYAVEPAAIGSSWETFRYLIEKFGFQEGRLISRFPAKWERLVIDAAKMADIGDIARKRITEKLREAKEKDVKIINSGRKYDPDLGSWVANARAADVKKPFHGIIAQGNHKEDKIVASEDLEENHRSWSLLKAAVFLERAKGLWMPLFHSFSQRVKLILLIPFLASRSQNAQAS